MTKHTPQAIADEMSRLLATDDTTPLETLQKRAAANLSAKPPANAYMYEPSITRVRDTYGRFYWVATRQLEMSNKTMLHICNGKGLLRAYTKAGNDGQNSLHREDVAEILQERKP